MQRMVLVIFVASMVFWPLGCGESYEPAPSSKVTEQAKEQTAAETTVQSEQPTAVSEPEPAAVASEPEPVETPAVEPTPTPQIQPRPASPPPVMVAPQLPISLDLGVALAQTGPNGTMMMFNVEYEFVVGEPDPKAGYVWVIERAKGTTKKLKVQLQNKNTLITPIDGWRPEQGPFHSHIEDSKGKRLSDSIEMQ